MSAYRKPPTGSRFQPGRSGNPQGRPKGARNRQQGPAADLLRAIVLVEANRAIKVNDGDRRITLKMAQAVVRSLAVNAARGQLRSQQFFVALLAETERANGADWERYLGAVMEYKISREEELDRRAKLGISGREPLPHPDHIEFDHHTGRIVIKGPMTRQEKVAWDGLHRQIRNFDTMIDSFEEDLKNCSRSPHRREFLHGAIADAQRDRKKLVDLVGEPEERERPA
jgi:Family of unknown function (DUF5681)